MPGYHSWGDGYNSVHTVAVETLLKTDTYLDVGDFSGFLQTTNFTQGMSIKDSFGDVRYLVFVSIPAEASMRFVQNMIKTFIMIIIFAVVITLIATYLIVRQTLRPIEAISRSAKSFARGDYSVRVPLPKIHDELYTLTDSFNSMAEDIEKSEIEQRGLIANVSHHLRTPMTTIPCFVVFSLAGPL